jgi:hypothetical protein
LRWSRWESVLSFISTGGSVWIIRRKLCEWHPLFGLGDRAIFPGTSNATSSVEAAVQPCDTLRIDRPQPTSIGGAT